MMAANITPSSQSYVKSYVLRHEMESKNKVSMKLSFRHCGDVDQILSRCDEASSVLIASD